MRKQFILATTMMLGFMASLFAQDAKEVFVAGHTTVFVSDLASDAVDRPSSQWTVSAGGTCVVTEIGDQKALRIEGEKTRIYPVGVGVLPESFTLEYEIWSDKECPGALSHNFNVEFTDDNNDRVIMLVAFNPCVGPDHSKLNYEYIQPTGVKDAGAIDGNKINAFMKPFSWTKVQVAYKNGAFTTFINGKQIIKPIQTAKPRVVRLCGVDREDVPFFVRNFRLTK